ncbi:hypothetical protein X946_5574 [Burkholderia sp. ABCPW 111]|nr:hypothetical protein X946_5574 [Burkholderia sp. ABCPW 111]
MKRAAAERVPIPALTRRPERGVSPCDARRAFLRALGRAPPAPCHAMPSCFAVASIARFAFSTISSISVFETTSGGDSSIRSPVARMIRLPLKQ